jgi:hypothetical protein
VDGEELPADLPLDRLVVDERVPVGLPMRSNCNTWPIVNK